MIAEVRSEIAEVKPRRSKFRMPCQVFFTSALLLLTSALSFSQTADELIAKNLAARGGVQKLRAIQTMVMTGTISFRDASSPITVKVRRPNQLREEFQVGGVDLVRVYNGVAGWESKGGQVRDLVGGELANIRGEAENAIEGPLLDYSKKGNKVRAVGRDTFNGKPVFKLKITTKQGTTITQFLDASSYLEMHEEIERYSDGKLVTFVEEVADYREVNGFKFAHLFVSGTRQSPLDSTFQIDKIVLNESVTAETFAKPSK